MNEHIVKSEIPDYTPAQIMGAISSALRAGDMPAAAGLVRLLAVKDPTSAQMILDVLALVTPPGSGDADG